VVKRLPVKSSLQRCYTPVDRGSVSRNASFFPGAAILPLAKTPSATRLLSNHQGYRAAKHVKFTAIAGVNAVQYLRQILAVNGDLMIFSGSVKRLF
jgi:hypothetical protein